VRHDASYLSLPGQGHESADVKVQTWLADDPSERDAERCETVLCLVCARRHLINFKTGEVIGEGGQ